jgi:APA family basic amino acid/polyamine antiporter
MLTGVFICLLSGLMPIHLLEEMVSIGTLMAFALVCGSVLALRVTRPEVERPFVCPVVWIVAPLGVMVNVLMMAFLSADTWLRLIVWLAVGLAIYFSYGIHRSRLGHELQRQLQREGASPTDAPLP